MSAELVALVVYDSVLFERGHMVRRWADGLERTFTMHAIAEAPLNKRASKGRGAPPVGTLKAGIHGDVDKIGPKMLQTTISSDAPYSMYVIGGTGPVISGEPFMWLPKNPGFGTRQKVQHVSGQAPNNFLGRAAGATARRHPSLRGMEDRVFSQW